MRFCFLTANEKCFKFQEGIAVFFQGKRLPSDNHDLNRKGPALFVDPEDKK